MPFTFSVIVSVLSIMSREEKLRIKRVRMLDYLCLPRDEAEK